MPPSTGNSDNMGIMLGEVRQGLRDMKESLHDLRAFHEVKYSATDARLSAMEARLAGVETNVQRNSERLTAINGSMAHRRAPGLQGIVRQHWQWAIVVVWLAYSSVSFNVDWEQVNGLVDKLAQRQLMMLREMPMDPEPPQSTAGR